MTGVTHGIGINAITGTVVEDLLWAYEYVPSGVCFKLNADLIPPVGQSLGIEEINALLSALLSVGSSPPLALGQGRTHGQAFLDQALAALFVGFDAVDALHREIG